MINQGPHQNQYVATDGKPLTEARAAMILVHGRGATAESIITLGHELHHADFAYLAPQAANNTWYPYGFMEEIAKNEPGISSGLTVLEQLVDQIVEAGIPTENIVLAGFSQGACLSSEFIARHATQYGGLLAFSGGLIGPDGTPRDYPGSLDGTPVFLGCSDNDFHIPKERVQHTADILANLGGQVTMRLYPDMGHTINEDELEFAQKIVDGVLRRS